MLTICWHIVLINPAFRTRTSEVQATISHGDAEKNQKFLDWFSIALMTHDTRCCEQGIPRCNRIRPFNVNTGATAILHHAIRAHVLSLVPPIPENTMTTQSDSNFVALFSGSLVQPNANISYSASKKLALLFPDRYVLETQSSVFDLDDFAIAGHCTASLNSNVHNQLDTSWHGAEYGLNITTTQAWQVVEWQNHEIDVIKLTWPASYCNTTAYQVIAANREIAEEFFVAVCSWCSAVRGEVLVFEQGYWQKSKALYDSIGRACYDQIILAGSLKQRIHDDFARFFSSRETYNRYGVPLGSAGALFIGPLGNGKNYQMVKAPSSRR